MKKLVALLMLVVLVSGCATVGPALVDPRVYNSSSEAMRAKMKSTSMEEGLHQQYIKNELESLQQPKHGTAVIEATGEQVGQPAVLFINKSSECVDVKVVDARGRDRSAWGFELAPGKAMAYPGDDKEADAFQFGGRYAVRWRYGNRTRWYADSFEVGFKARRDSSLSLWYNGGYQFNPEYGGF